MKKLAVALVMTAILAPRPGRGDPPAAPPQPSDDLERAYLRAGDDPRVRSVCAGEPGLPSIALERYRLPNGLDVVLSPGGSESRVAVRVTYAVGTRDAPAGRSELAHLVEHLSYGPTRRIPENLLEAEEALGAATVWGTTGLRETAFGVEVPPEALERALWIESERMAGALDEVGEAALARERRILAREWVRTRHVSGFEATQAISAASVAAGRPPHAPAEEDSSGSLAEVRGFARRWYVPANARLTVVGRFSPPLARAWVARYFGPIAPGVAPVRAADPATAPLDAPLVTQARRSHPGLLEQVAVAWPAPSPDEPGGVEMDLLGHCLAAADFSDPLNRAGLLPEVRVVTLRPENGRLLMHSPPDFPALLLLFVDVPSDRTTEAALGGLDGALAGYRDDLGRAGCDGGVVRDYARRLVAAAGNLAERAARVSRWPDPDDPGAFRRHIERARAFGLGGLDTLVRRWFAADRRFVAHVARAPDATR